MVPCLAVFPISPRFGKVDLEILKQLADVYYAFLYYKMKDMFNNKPSEIRTLIYEELKTKKGEFFQWMVDEYLPNAPRIKKERENLCRYYLWAHHFCMQPCPISEGLGFIIKKIIKEKTAKPNYIVHFNDLKEPLKVTLPELATFNRFNLAFCSKYNFFVKKPIEPWQDVLNFLFRYHLQEEEITTKEGIEEYDESDLINELRYWVDTVQTEHTYDDLQNNKPILKDGNWYAKGDAIYEKLRTFGKRSSIFQTLKEVFHFEKKVIRLGGNVARVWLLKFPEKTSHVENEAQSRDASQGKEEAQFNNASQKDHENQGNDASQVIDETHTKNASQESEEVPKE